LSHSSTKDLLAAVVLVGAAWLALAVVVVWLAEQELAGGLLSAPGLVAEEE
jgi:hypothetical protein